MIITLTLFFGVGQLQFLITIYEMWNKWLKFLKFILRTYRSDMPIFGDADHPSVSLRLHNMQRPINILTGEKTISI